LQLVIMKVMYNHGNQQRATTATQKINDL
jgi:hypothetical protein